MMIRPIRVAAWPNDTGNPYQSLFYGALAPLGVERVGGLEINDACLERLAPLLDVVHLHWPEYAWRVRGPRPASEARLVVGLHRFLRLAHRLDLRVWWTAHNTAPHEGHALINWVGYLAVARAADLVIVHTARAASEIRKRYGVDRSVVVPHGNYRGMYPPPRAREAVRAELGISNDRPMVACLGTVRAYKGVQTAIDAVVAIGGAVQLVVAGDPKPDVDLRALEARAAGRPWVRLSWQRLSDQRFADLASASDAVLLPYHQATTSGVLLAAWTLGRGVIASDLPYFVDELSQFPDAGSLATVDDALSLARAIQSFVARPAGQREAAALQAAGAREWARSVEGLVPHLEAIAARMAREHVVC